MYAGCRPCYQTRVVYRNLCMSRLTLCQAEAERRAAEVEEQTSCWVHPRYTVQLYAYAGPSTVRQRRRDKVEEQMSCRVYTYTVPITLPIHLS
jgi:hypothetical protein